MMTEVKPYRLETTDNISGSIVRWMAIALLSLLYFILHCPVLGQVTPELPAFLLTPNSKNPWRNGINQRNSGW